MKRGFIYTIILISCLATVSFGNRADSSFVSGSGDIQNRTVNDLSLKSDESVTIQTASTLVVSDEKPVNVNQNGSITLVSGKAIVLLPGTKISSGGFMYASINPDGKKGKQVKKITKLVTVEEHAKLEEQATLAEAVSLFSPFPSSSKRQLSNPYSGGNSIVVSSQQNSALVNESNVKQFAIPATRLIIERVTNVQQESGKTMFCSAFSECRYVLRL
jgi:archaellum component FlaF (FlaF/FlaG flagellin family)